VGRRACWESGSRVTHRDYQGPHCLRGSHIEKVRCHIPSPCQIRAPGGADPDNSHARKLANYRTAVRVAVFLAKISLTRRVVCGPLPIDISFVASSCGSACAGGGSTATGWLWVRGMVLLMCCKPVAFTLALSACAFWRKGILWPRAALSAFGKRDSDDALLCTIHPMESE